MKKHIFAIEEMEICFSALAFMFIDHSAREDYNDLLLDNKIEFPSNDLDIISNILTSYMGQNDILQDYNVAQELVKLKRYSDITSCTLDDISKINFNAFLDKIKGNIDVLKDIPVINYGDNKQAFLSYLNGNLRALINSNDKKKFANWNSMAWELLTDEETYIFYGSFIQQCYFELTKNESNFDKKAYLEISKKVAKWDTERSAKGALSKLRRSKSHVIDLNQYDLNKNIICSKNGTIINFNTGEIKKANRNDMILFTSKYNFINKNDSTTFINEKLYLYKNVLGQERLNFLLDLISYKMLGKKLQLAIFLIGTGGTGKSLFKNIVRDLFENDVQSISYEYFTRNHRGNEDKSRDDILAALDNKLWGLSSESDSEEDQSINQARFKTILSNSTESARPTKGTLIDVNLKRLDLLIDTNNMPRFTNVDYAISRRLLFVNFINRIPTTKVNSNYYTEEIIPNFDKVFSYFVHRAIGLINKKLIIPEVIINDTKQNIEGVDSVAKFATERIMPMSGSFIRFEEIEKEYIKFCNDEDMPNIIPTDKVPGKKCTTFTNALKEKLSYEKIFSQRRSNGSCNDKTYVIHGVIFKDTDDTNLFGFESEESNPIQQIINIKPKSVGTTVRC